jgi:hypothetical protein
VAVADGKVYHRECLQPGGDLAKRTEASNTIRDLEYALTNAVNALRYALTLIPGQRDQRILQAIAEADSARRKVKE